MTQFMALDFETSHYGADSACSIGLAIVKNNQVIHTEHHLIQPPKKQIMFTHIHGIKWEDLKDKPTFPHVWRKISHLFEDLDFIAAHNASFDQRVLMGTCASYGIKPPDVPFVCTVSLARQKWNLFPTKLPNVCEHLGIELNHHHALSDALACAKIVIASETNH